MSVSSSSISVADASLDARVRQLAQEARFNARLRAQQQRIRELVEQNKVYLVFGCWIWVLLTRALSCVRACVRACLLACLLALLA